MNPTKELHDLGQSLWLDNITRKLVNGGTLQRYIDELSVTGLTSNPTIFDHAIKNSADYDSDISRSASRAEPPENLFFELALGDVTHIARPVCCGGRGLPARGRAAHRGRTQPGHRVGCLALCQPLGCRD